MTTGHGLTGIADAGAFLARLTRLDPTAPVRLRPAASATAPRDGHAVPTADRAGAAGERSASAGERAAPSVSERAVPAAGERAVPAAGERAVPAAGERAVPAGRTALWARLPWGVLVTREVAGAGPGDATVRAADLLEVLARDGADLPARRDGLWRWPLPPAGGRVVETVAAAELVRLTTAAAGTLRNVTAAGLSGRAVGQRAVRDALLDHVALIVTPSGSEPVEVSQRLVQGVSQMGFLGPAGADGPGTRVCVTGRWVGLSAPYGVAWLPPVQELTVMPISSHPFG